MLGSSEAPELENAERAASGRAETSVPLGQEPSAVSRKKALLRLLCVAEAKRSGVSPSAAQYAEFCERFRRAFAIDDECQLAEWLAQNGLERAEFERLLFELCVQSMIEERMEPHVQRELGAQSAIWTLHTWAQVEEGR